MSRRASTQIVAAIVVAVFPTGSWMSGTAVKASWLRYYSVAVLVAVGLLNAWDRWIWRIPALQRFDLVPPAMSGTWRGTLVSAWVDPATGGTPQPRTVYLIIRQSSSNVSVLLLTDESRSSSTFGRVLKLNGVSSLDYMYLNRPDSSVEHRSRMHHGSASLDVTGSPATRLRGRYWTDRDSKGELDFTEHVGELAGDFSDAGKFFGKP
jgi:SMODS-associating 2TM, beta-strand rich effector domain